MLSKTYPLSATGNSYRSFVHVHFLGGLIGMLELHEKTRNRAYGVCWFVCVECICRILAEHVKHKTSRIREWGCGKRTYFHLSTCSGEFGTRTFPLRPISFFSWIQHPSGTLPYRSPCHCRSIRTPCKTPSSCGVFWQSPVRSSFCEERLPCGSVIHPLQIPLPSISR